MIRRLRSLSLVALGLVGLLGLAACSSDEADASAPQITVEGAYIPAPAGANAALYFTVANTGDGSDHLVEARASFADEVELHRSFEGDDGLMKMESVEKVEVPAEGEVIFEPGGLHVMLLGISELAEGDTVEVELVFDQSGVITVDADIVAMSHSEHDDHDHHDH